jgi:thiamine-phosphate pyrophosphorylase
MAFTDGDDRRERLQAARLYLVTPIRPGGRDLADVLVPALRGGVDIVQIRDKEAVDGDVLAAAAVARRLCDAAGALLILNDRPDLVGVAGADGVHVGQGDAAPAAARAAVGPDRLVGVSTHDPRQIAAAHEAGAADLIGVGPVHETPTKPGRPAVGLELVRHAAAHAALPWFAIGGIDADTVAAVAGAGAARIAVVRALVLADDPEAAARTLRAALPAEVMA